MLTATDVELFSWLWMLRVLTLGQLRRLGYFQPGTGRLSSLHNVRKRLRRLYQAGYLADDRMVETRERIYFLTEQALPELRERFGIRQRRLYQPRGEETERQLQHALLVSEGAVRFVESIRRSSFELSDLAPLGVPFLTTHAVGNPAKRKHVERFVTQEDVVVAGESVPLRIRPDLVFALRQGKRARLYFLEADRGSESSQQLATKLLAYHHYLKASDPTVPENRLWQRYGEVRDFRVLLVTTTPRRVKNLAESLAEQPGFELLSMTDVEAFKAQNVLFEGIWRNRVGVGRGLARARRP